MSEFVDVQSRHFAETGQLAYSTIISWYERIDFK
jgi:hypothetical protein